MQLEFLMEFDSDICDQQDLGSTPFGKRTIYAVKDGRFAGPKLKGRIRTGAAADWMMTNNNGLSKLDVRKTFETDDGALILVTYQGLYQFDEQLSTELEHGRGYEFGDTLFQAQIQFETSDERYDWLNKTLAVAEAKETGTKVIYRAYALV